MNPTQGVLEARIAEPRGRHRDRGRAARRAGRRERPGGRDPRHPQPGRGGQPHRVVGRALRRHLQPAALHAAQDRHRDHLHRRPRRPRRVAGRGPAQHQGVLRRDDRQPAQRHPRHRGRVGGGARERRAADRRQHGGDAVPDPPARVGRRHRRALGHQVHRRPRHLDRRRSSSTAARSTSAPATSSRSSPSPTPATTGWPTGRRSAPGPTSSRPGCSCCATSVPAITPFNAFLFLQGARDAEPAHGAPHRQRPGGRRVPRGPRPGRVGAVRRAARARRGTSGPSATAVGGAPARCRRSSSRAAPRPAEVRRGAAAAQPRRQHRRRAQPGHPAGVDHPLAAHAPRSRSTPGSSPASCASRSASSRSTTSSPTSTPASPPPAAADQPAPSARAGRRLPGRPDAVGGEHGRRA